MSNSLNIMLGDSLPTIYDVAINIFSICCKPGSKKMEDCIYAYSQALILQWTKAFGEGYVLAISNVKQNLLIVVSDYYNRVYEKQFRTKSKKKGCPFIKKSLRQLNKEWRKSTIQKGRHKKNILYIDKLFDIGINMDSLTGDEATFYADQLGSRRGRISEDVDLKYVSEKQTELELAQAAVKKNMMEESYIMEIDVEPPVFRHSDSSTSGVSLSRSGLPRLTAHQSHFSVQCCLSNRPSLRLVRNCTDTIKNTLCEISVKCNLSLEASRLAFKTACSSFYGHNYFLSKEEAIKNHTDDVRTSSFTSSSSSLSVKSSKRSRKSSLTLSEASKKVPHTNEDWRIYEFVLPSTRTLTDHKQIKAVQHKNQASIALYLKPDNIKSTLHFYETSRLKLKQRADKIENGKKRDQYVQKRLKLC